MAVTIFIPITHRGFAKGNKTVSLDAVTLKSATLAGAILRLQNLFPELDGRIMEGGERLIPGMEVTVNGRPVFPFSPGLYIADGDEIRISSIITGG